MTDNILNIFEPAEEESIMPKMESLVILPTKTKASAKKKKAPSSGPFIAKKPTKLIKNEIMVTVSEAAKIGGITSKTIRRAIQSKNVAYTVSKDRYNIELTSLLNFLLSNKKLKNKFNECGIGQFIEKWRL